ncbi:MULTISPECIES: aspartate/glutamate racemase family protein [Symbiopectobacterium]|uniref:aspartate/glutamate racemase family protein n=1 Tax=Symbiopectobacterium TaxID=801 RepID=UPI001A1ACD38|nr:MULTISPECIES: aspartate/glutamate racemase family protein [Symbiopectobacterium]MBG6246812.1 aspartate/glutamate racemase family protein [Candidatus Symbiopectobacterium sp. PLON1]MBT9430148.1 aspartate/glutamate racemase family protein [Candidatus Symbiopectobacterium endolongispinus]
MSDIHTGLATPQATLGILMVKTHFRLYLGDIGNPGTWPFPVRYRVVEEDIPQRMGHLDQHDLLEPFKRAAKALIDEGVDGLITSCGFLSYYQQELAAWSPVPIVTSSLLQYQLVQRLLPAGKTPLILTFDDRALRGDYLEKVGIPGNAHVVGMAPDSEFVRSIRDGDDSVPHAILQQEVPATAQQALDRYPQTGALVLECTNLAPFSATLHARFGLPVFDTVSLVRWFYGALQPRAYDGGDNWCR